MTNTFDTLGLNPVLLKTLRQIGHHTPTPIQVQAIPQVLEGRDLMGLAQTGTGKTAAFGLPLIQQLMGVGAKPQPRTARALILAPTRELVNQIATSLRAFTRPTHLRVTAVVGGASIHIQSKNLERGADILVATPGRLLDLIERKAVSLRETRYLVLDEADQMLDLGFIHPLRKIAGMVGKPRQTLLFSATMPKQIAELSTAFLTDPVRVQVSPPGRAADKVRQSVHLLPQRAKLDKLKECLAETPDGLSLVFARTKHGAEKLMKQLVAHGVSAGSIHGNKSQGQRERAIQGFRDGNIRVLVATDVAARGIDIPGVSHVYNFDLPEVAESYVHRIGRTARAGADGEAIAFCGAHEAHLLRGIEKLLGISVAVASRSDEADVEEKKPAGRSGGNGRGRNGNNGGAPRPDGADKPRRRRFRAKNKGNANGGGGFKPRRQGKPAQRRSA
ncbi:MAG: DEAD/DEAH box helicase [Brucellaceae bacterium]|nr:DEAD/DEAH box helicase [Brucellaceae bacterium]